MCPSFFLTHRQTETHLGWASRTSPCHVSWARCVTALWTTRWRWSCRADSLQRMSWRSSRHRSEPALWEPDVWMPSVAGSRPGSEEPREHASDTKERKIKWYTAPHDHHLLQSVNTNKTLLHLNERCRVCVWDIAGKRNPHPLFLRLRVKKYMNTQYCYRKWWKIRNVCVCYLFYTTAAQTHTPNNGHK